MANWFFKGVHFLSAVFVVAMVPWAFQASVAVQGTTLHLKMPIVQIIVIGVVMLGLFVGSLASAIHHAG